MSYGTKTFPIRSADPQLDQAQARPWRVAQEPRRWAEIALLWTTTLAHQRVAKASRASFSKFSGRVGPWRSDGHGSRAVRGCETANSIWGSATHAFVMLAYLTPVTDVPVSSAFFVGKTVWLEDTKATPR